MVGNVTHPGKFGHARGEVGRRVSKTRRGWVPGAFARNSCSEEGGSEDEIGDPDPPSCAERYFAFPPLLGEYDSREKKTQLFK